MKTTSGPSLLLILLLGWSAAAHARSLEEWIRQGDALETKLLPKPALEAYLEAEKLGTPPATLLHRIARQHGLSMNDEPTEAGKKAAAEKALTYARRAVAADPKDADAQVALAICYGRLVRFMETKVQIQYSRLIKESAEAALRLNPKQELGWYVLGSWHYEMANLSALKRGLARIIYGAMPPASHAGAADFFNRAIALNPARMASYVDLGLTYIELDRKTEARAMLLKGLALPDRERDDPQVRNRARIALEKLSG